MADGDEAHGGYHGEGRGRAHHRRCVHLPPVEHLAVERGRGGIATERSGHSGERVVQELCITAVDERDGRWRPGRGPPEECLDGQGRLPSGLVGTQKGSTARATMSRARMVATGKMAASWRAMLSAATGAAR